MEKGKSLLILRLEGPLQSWGEASKWDYRDSGAMPTKSGIVGLVACAMGLRRGDPYIKALSDRLRIAVRADRTGTLMTDYHTVQSEKGILNAEGKTRGDTIVSHRSYLQDACFTVAIEADDALAEKISAAFEAPAWVVFLGRKSCVPSGKVFLGVFNEYDDLISAIEKYPFSKRHDERISCETDAVPEISGVSYARPDALINAADRSFAYRRVSYWPITEE